MKKMHKLRYFALGLVVALLISVMVNPALAALMSKNIKVSTGVNLYVDDNKFIPKDANGNPVEVFIYNGTTYLPARAISEMLGKPVQWEGATSSVYIGKHSSSTPAVLLQDMKPFYEAEYGFTPYTSVQDNLGNTRYNCLDIYFRINNTYKIDAQYKRIAGTFFLPDSRRNASVDSVLEIYGDERLLYTAKVTGGVEPIDFDVNLTGVLELRIRMNHASSRVTSTYGDRKSVV